MRHSKLIVISLSLGACSDPVVPTTFGPPPPATPTGTPSGTSRPSPTTTPTTNPTPPVPTPTEALPPLFADPVRHARAVPLAGGTLLVTSDGLNAVAADPDRDQVFLVDLPTHAVRAVALVENDEPGRVVEGPPGRVYVAARRGGVVIDIDLASGAAVRRLTACSAPRGIAYDAALGRLHVACRSGRLVSLDAASGAIVSTLSLDEDLRDVVVSGGSLVVTRFRSAEVLVVDSLGQVLRRAAPAAAVGMRAAVAYRAVPHPSGTVTIAHQLVSDSPLGTGAGAYYGGGCSGGGAVVQALTTVAPDGRPLVPAPVEPGQLPRPDLPPERPDGLYAASITVPGTVGPTDTAFSRDGTRLALLVPGHAWIARQELPTLFVTTIDDPAGRAPTGFGPCGPVPSQGRHAVGEPVAVAFDASGRYVVQSREPALLELEGDVFIPLSADSHFDTGFAMFHMNAGAGISCASCHPEGGEDGHAWSFTGIGLRRSQPLEGGVSRRTPFHWSGDLPTFDVLFDEVMLKRMLLPVVPPRESSVALATWLDTIAEHPSADGLDPAAVERGRALFVGAAACADCHSGEAYADHVAHDVGTGGTFVTPSLRGVGLRAPLFHDGCATTLRARFGPCGGSAHGNTAGLDDAAIDDLVAFMMSL